MNTILLKWSRIALLPAVLLVLASCSTGPSGEKPVTAVTVAQQDGVPGGTTVQTTTASATVTAIDAASRKVTIVGPEGRKTTFKAGPDVVNFDQIKVGDQVRATLTEELVVWLRAKDEPVGDGYAAAVALAPVGAKPGVVMADTVQVVAKVTGIDIAQHRATLSFPDGTSKTVAVRSDVDLTKRRVGEEVVIRSTEALAILVEKK